MSDTPKVDIKLTELCHDKAGFSERLLGVIEFARTLERELQAANKVIADAKEYEEEFRDFFPDDGLLAILERRTS
jgi:hypothetical protein